MKRRNPSRSPLALAVLLSVSWFAHAADVAFTEPLTLARALAIAGSRPLATEFDAAVGPPHTPSLYLNCHRLAFASLEDVDEHRNRVIDAFIDPIVVRRLQVLRRYFDVLLADINFARFNEAMAVAFIRYDRAAVRAELGQYSELHVAELDAVYQRVRHQRASSESTQRITRSLLAQAMGDPVQLPRNLAGPMLLEAPSSVPTLGAVLAGVVNGNTWLQRRLANLDENGRGFVEMELRQAALELVMRLQLLDSAAAAAGAESAWRDLKLDESRTLYEMEYAADLGYSMSQQTKTRFDDERVALCGALTRAELRALQGRPVWTISEPSK